MRSFEHSPVSWCLNSNIYEVNIRQYTPEGTFEAFGKHLPRLAGMGVEILWFMPITPIAKEKRLGTLGSYYACSSYTDTNPEFGSVKEFTALVKQAHSLGMKVIIDWVANHTGHGHEWTKKNREFFVLGPNGEFTERNGWADVIDLNFNNPAMRRAMIDAMAFWVKHCDIDGFRCDMAHLVPLEFWEQARTALDKKKKLFWLAECEVPAYHKVFDATYAWEWMHITEQYCKSVQTVSVLDKVLYRYSDEYPARALKLFFTSNHDENSWNGTEYEKYGGNALPLAVFSCTWSGLPLIYSGQEIPNTKRLKFFDKDQLDWNHELRLEEFYRKLFELRKSNPALNGGDTNVITNRINVSGEQVFCFLKRNGNREVLVMLNFSQYAIQIYLHDGRIHGIYHDVFRGGIIDFDSNRSVVLHGYGYFVWQR